jgi:hypothetical protein
MSDILPGYTRLHDAQVIFRRDLSYFDRVVYAALATYRRDSDPRPAVVLAEVARRLGTSRPRVSEAVGRLKAKGLVEDDLEDGSLVFPLFEGRDVPVPPAVRAPYRPQYGGRIAGGTPRGRVPYWSSELQSPQGRESSDSPAAPASRQSEDLRPPARETWGLFGMEPRAAKAEVVRDENIIEGEVLAEEEAEL